MDGADTFSKRQTESGPETLLLVLDCSSSMLDGNYQDCKKVIEEALCPPPPISGGYPDSLIADDVLLGLREFGESSPNIAEPCKQSELVVRPGLANRSQILDKLNHIPFGGSTPLTYAIRQIPADLARARGPKHVILFSDGDGNCPDEDACNELDRVQKQTGARIDIIGLRGANVGLLNCLNNLHNPYISAKSAESEDLGDIFGASVRKDIQGKVLPRQSSHRLWDKFRAFLRHDNNQHHCNCHSHQQLDRVQAHRSSATSEGK